MNNKNEQQVVNVFNVCDLDGSGDIDKQELKIVCNHLNNEQIDRVFDTLDTNKDGLISFDEFSKGFNEIESKTKPKISKNELRIKKKNEIYEKSRNQLKDQNNNEKDLIDDSFLFETDLDNGFKLLSW